MTYQPLLAAGRGRIELSSNVKIGVITSPGFWSSECYLEARSSSASITIGKDTWINNNFSAISAYGSIAIGKNCLIGHDVTMLDSDFHQIDPEARKQGVRPTSSAVVIGDNVFVGSRVTVLKGSCVGDGSVVAANSVVSGRFPSRSLIAGNPGKLIKAL